ncbi:MAG: hypothetical protein H7A37_04680 [Chlamydiales bacterium]|nr:hypothetical protein [Chlamydiia bacterium]MCP5507578.1 hypothetical protein [Chlamydiales bacterium]
MKDQAHHLKHLQKKVYRSAKRQQSRVKKPTEFMESAEEETPEVDLPRSKTSDQLSPRTLNRGHQVH